MKQLKYAGLRIEDEAALLEAKEKGAEWVARDKNRSIFGYTSKPHKHDSQIWVVKECDLSFEAHFIRSSKLSFIKWSDPEPVNIGAALAQIEEMKLTAYVDAKYSKPRTNQDALLEKWRDEIRDMAKAFVRFDWDEDAFYVIDEDGFNTADWFFGEEEAIDNRVAWLLSPAEDGK